MEAHYRACLFAGLILCGCNAEVTPGQLEYQIGPCVGVTIGDELWMARYIMERITEEFGIIVSLHPKPMLGDWNPTGCHTSKYIRGGFFLLLFYLYIRFSPHTRKTAKRYIV